VDLGCVGLGDLQDFGAVRTLINEVGVAIFFSEARDEVPMGNTHVSEFVVIGFQTVQCGGYSVGHSDSSVVSMAVQH